MDSFLINIQERINQTNALYDMHRKQGTGLYPPTAAMCSQILNNQLTIMRLILRDHGVEDQQ